MTATTANEFAASASASASTDKEAKKESMSTWGCTWRVTLAIAVFAAAVVAICYGGKLAISYVAGMGLSALATSIAMHAIAALAGILSAALGWFTGNFCIRTLADREAAKCASAA